MAVMESLIISTLYLCGLGEQAVGEALEHTLQHHAMTFVHWLMEVIRHS